MVTIDMPMPERCADCPCSYWIQSGEYEGLMMCNAMEFKAHRGELREISSEYFIVQDDHRPDDCPMTETK